MPLLLIPLVIVVAFLWLVFRKRPASRTDALISSGVESAGSLPRSDMRALPSTAVSRTTQR